MQLNEFLAQLQDPGNNAKTRQLIVPLQNAYCSPYMQTRGGDHIQLSGTSSIHYHYNKIMCIRVSLRVCASECLSACVLERRFSRNE